MSDDKKDEPKLEYVGELQILDMEKMRAGDIIFRAGALLGGMPTGVTPDHGGNIQFELGDHTVVLLFAPDGKVYVRGELVHDNLAIWAALREWLVHANIVRDKSAELGMKPS